MAANRVALVVEILAETTGLSKGMDDAANKVSGFESTISKLTPAAAIVAGGLALLGKDAVDSASAVEQALGGLDAVFGANSATVKKWAADAAQSLGLSESAYADLATTVGAQLQNMGLDTEAAMGGTQDLINLGADLAATFGGTTEEAVSALSASLRGEADSAEKYGLALNVTAVNAKLAEDGMAGLEGSQLQTAKANAILELATEQAGGAVGAFAKESDTLAGQQARTAAETENMKAALGEALLPAVTAVTAALGSLVGFVTQNSTAVLILAGVIGGLAVAVLAINAALKVYKATTIAVEAVQKLMAKQLVTTRIQLLALEIQTKVVTIATKAWGIATKVAAAAMKLLSANPLILIVAAIIAIVAGIIHLWQTSEAFRDAVMGIWAAIQSAAEVCWNAIKAVVMFVINFIMAYIEALLAVATAVWNGILSAATAVWNAIKAVVDFVIKIITAYIQAYLAIVTAVWNGIKAAAQFAWNGVKSIIDGVINAIKSTITGLSSFVEGVWNNIKSITTTVWNGIKNAIENALKPIKAIISGIESAFQGVVNVVQNLIGLIGRIKIPDLSALNPFKSAPKMTVATVPGPALGGRLAASPAATTSSGGGGIVVNVNGALDPVGVARQIRAILRDDDRRRQGVRLVGRTAT